MKEETKEHVYRGARLGFGAIVGISAMGVLAFGFEKLRFPEVDDNLFTFLKSYPPRLIGGVCVAIACAVLVSTVDYWAKMLAGLFAYAAFGSLLAVAAGGFHSQVASLQLSRLEVTLMTALFAACAVLTIRLGKDQLGWVDRMAALSTPLLLVWAGTSNDAATGFKVLGSMMVIFAAATGYDYIGRHHRKIRSKLGDRRNVP